MRFLGPFLRNKPLRSANAGHVGRFAAIVADQSPSPSGDCEVWYRTEASASPTAWGFGVESFVYAGLVFI
jgi:hypothetical protein